MDNKEKVTPAKKAPEKAASAAKAAPPKPAVKAPSAAARKPIVVPGVSHRELPVAPAVSPKAVEKSREAPVAPPSKAAPEPPKAAPVKPKEVVEETPAEKKFRADLAAAVKLLNGEAGEADKLDVLLRLNEDAGYIPLGRLNDAMSQLAKLKAEFLASAADSACIAELIYFGYSDEIISPQKSAYVQDFLLNREIMDAEAMVLERAAYTSALAEAKLSILSDARETNAAVEQINLILTKISRQRIGTIDRVNSEKQLAAELDKLCQLKIGDFVTLPPIARSKTPKPAPAPVPPPAPAQAPPAGRPDINKAFDIPKPDRDKERMGIRRDEDEIKRALSQMKGGRDDDDDDAVEMDVAPVRPKSMDEGDDYVDKLSQNSLAENWAAQIEALYKRFIGLIDGGETEKRDQTVSSLFPAIEKLDRQHARLARLVETVKASKNK